MSKLSRTKTKSSAATASIDAAAETPAPTDNGQGSQPKTTNPVRYYLCEHNGLGVLTRILTVSKSKTGAVKSLEECRRWHPELSDNLCCLRGKFFELEVATNAVQTA